MGFLFPLNGKIDYVVGGFQLCRLCHGAILNRIAKECQSQSPVHRGCGRPMPVSCAPRLPEYRAAWLYIAAAGALAALAARAFRPND